MKKLFIIPIAAIIISSGTICHAQSLMRVDTSHESVQYWQQWMNDLNSMGLEKKNDTFYMREEVVKLLKDPEYRKTVYPGIYNWPATISFLNSMELKKAFWQMINLYETDTAHRNIVIGTVVMYDSLIDMDKILLSTFYTYAFTDPEVCRVTNNKPEIFRPDILEKKLRLTREIIAHIWEYRRQKAATSKN